MPDTAAAPGGRPPGRAAGLRALLAPPATRRPIWLATAGGALGALGHAPFDLWPVALAGFALLIHTLHRVPDMRSAVWAGWAGGLAYFIVALHWIVEPFLVDVARHGWMAPFALVLLSLFLAAYWAAGAALTQAIAPRGPMRLPVLVAALTLGEMLRGIFFTGFPWALVGHTLIASPFLPLGAVVGPDGMSLAVLAFAAGLACIPARRTAALPVLLAGGGLWLAMPLARPAPPPTPADAPLIRLLQPNAAQREKWLPEMIPVFLDRNLANSGADPAADLVVWPETSLPAFLEDADHLLSVVGEQARGAVSVVGVDRRADRQFWNALAVVQPDGAVSEVYEKHHLVPFGEFMPFGDFFARFGIRGLASWDGGGYMSGPGPAVIDTGAAGRAVPLICYEAVFPREIREAIGDGPRPDFLLQITNDAWFGNFSGPWQHLAQARLRAVEQGLPMIRAANTGVSAVIAADGTVVAELPLNEAGRLDVRRPAAASSTIYARYGGFPVTVLILATLAAALLLHLAGSRHRRS